DPAAATKQTDFTFALKLGEGEKTYRARGIYLLEGNTLKVCFAWNNNPRPDRFATTAAARSVLFTFQRGPAARDTDQPTREKKKSGNASAEAERDLARAELARLKLENQRLLRQVQVMQYA